MCQTLGDLKILGIENGIPDDLTPYSEHFRRTLQGRAAVYLRAGEEKGGAELHVRTASGRKASCRFTLGQESRQ